MSYNYFTPTLDKEPKILTQKKTHLNPIIRCVPFTRYGVCDYIIPIPPAPPAGIAGTSSLIFATTDSVVSNVEATDVAF